MLVLEAPRLGQHAAHRQVVGSAARLRPIAIHEQELVDPVSSRRKQVAPETEGVAVPGIQTGNRPPPHVDYLVRHSNARYRRPADVVIGDEKCRGHGAQHADLVPDPSQIGAGGRFDLTYNLERSLSHPWILGWAGAGEG